MTSESLLPAAFGELAPFVAKWDVATPEARMVVRRVSSRDELRALYDAVLARLDGIIEHLSAFEMGQFPEPEVRLYRLVLALCEASMTIELSDPALPASEASAAIVVSPDLRSIAAGKQEPV